MGLDAGVRREGVGDGASPAQFLEAPVRVRALAYYVFVEEAFDAYGSQQCFARCVRRQQCGAVLGATSSIGCASGGLLGCYNIASLR